MKMAEEGRAIQGNHDSSRGGWKEDQKNQKEIQKAVVDQMIKEADKQRNKVMISMLYLLGCRNNELVRIRRKDVRIGQEGLTISVKYSKKKKEDKQRGRRHDIYISNQSPYTSIIIDYVSQFEDPNEYLFQGYNKHLTERQVRNIVQDLAEEVVGEEEAEMIFPHLFRDNRINLLVDKAATAFQLQVWNGWSSSEPANHYIKESSQRIRDLGRKIE